MQTKHFIIAGAVALCATLDAAETNSITTRDGTTYTNAVIQRADPNGVVIEYAPQPGSVGIAKLKFANLPDELQRRYHYNATNALVFEQNHAAGIARRQEEIEQGEIEKRRLHEANLQRRAEEEEAEALEAKRQEDASNAAAQMQTEAWYGDWYSAGGRRRLPGQDFRVPPTGRVGVEPSPLAPTQLPARRPGRSR
jgi:hypothetical protein